MYTDFDKQTWGLWSHASWRELAVSGSYIVTTAFFSYVMGNLGDQCVSYSRGFMTLAVSFFVPYTAVQFPKLQKANEIKTENLSVYNSINQQLSKLERKYSLEPAETQSEEIQHFTQLISVIKTAAYNCLNITQSNIEKNSHEHLLKTKQLLEALLDKVNQFAATLPESSSQFDQEALKDELRFWQRDVYALQDDLIASKETPQSSLRMRI